MSQLTQLTGDVLLKKGAGKTGQPLRACSDTWRTLIPRLAEDTKNDITH
jgi:hypothetical protein